ncbi:MAG: urate hydroxylase PuuD [Planctomycetes bacterium]|nr:urate hydroxylase PuuD [Planctomycetota bacterium]
MEANFVVSTFIPMLLRWIHFLSGITWIGHLYFFNLVGGSFEKTLDADNRKKVVPQLRPRALWWFRWGAMFTMLSGVVYIIWEQFIMSPQPMFSTWFSEGKNWWITMGGLFGLIMWYNVWFIIWPRQKVIIPAVASGNKPADFDQLVATAGKFSRVNTYLSVPMLFGMGGRSHFPVGDSVGPNLAWMVAVIVVGIGTAWYFIYKVGPKVGTEFAAPASPPAAPPPPK